MLYQNFHFNAGMLKTVNRVSYSMTNAIRIDYKGMRPYLQEAVIKTNELFANPLFYDHIAGYKSFDLADVSPATIADLMRKTTINMTVELYYAMSPVKNIDGYDDTDHPDIIHMNIWKIERPVASLCNTLVHSCVHAVNACNAQYYFGHGDTSLKGKENTAPYKIGMLAELMTGKNEARYIALEHDTIDAGRKPIRDYMTQL